MLKKKLYYIIFILLFNLFSCSSNNNNSSKAINDDHNDSASLQIKGFILTETIEGAKKWELKALYANIYEKESSIHVEKINIIFYDENQPFSNLEAKEAAIDIRSKNILAKNNVKVISKNNVRLETDKLLWDTKEQVFTTDAFVRVIKKNSILEGNGLRTGANLENIKIFSNVKIVADSKDALNVLK